MRTKVNGIEVEYSITGSPERGAVRPGKWLVLIHGVGKDLSMWDSILPALSQRYRVLTYDLRGWGKSDKPPGPYSFQLWADDLYALLQALGIKRTALMGWSLGGYIIQQFMGQHADVVDAIVLADTTSYRPPEEGERQRQRAEQLEREGAKGMEEVAASQPERWWSEDFRKRNPEVVAKARESLRAMDHMAFAATSRSISQIDFVDTVKRITSPTLILVGSHDQGTPVSAAEKIKALIPGSQMHVIQGAQHDTISEQPERIASLVLEFLGGAKEKS